MAERPLISDWQPVNGGGFVGTVVVDPVADSVLSDHVYKGTPLLPAAAIVAIFAEAAERLGHAANGTVLEKLEFTNGVRCFTSAPQTLHVRVGPDDGGRTMQLTQEFRNRNGAMLDPARLCTSCVLPNKPPSFDDWGWETPPDSGWKNVVYTEGDGVNRLGPTLQGLKRLLLREDCGWSEILAADETLFKPGRRFPWRFSPGVFDAALVACNQWVNANRPGAMQIPMSMRRVWIGENPLLGTVLEETFHVQQIEDMSAAYDVRVRTKSGQMALKIDDYAVALIREPGETPIKLVDPA